MKQNYFLRSTHNSILFFNLCRKFAKKFLLRKPGSQRCIRYWKVEQILKNLGIGIKGAFELALHKIVSKEIHECISSDNNAEMTPFPLILFLLVLLVIAV